MSTYYASDGFYAPRNNFKDALLDKWLKQARETVDPAQRDRLYSLVGNRAYEQALYVLVPSGVGYSVYRDSIQGAGAANRNSMISFSNFGTGTFWKDLSKK